jgi:hypothetical protein
MQYLLEAGECRHSTPCGPPTHEAVRAGLWLERSWRPAVRAGGRRRARAVGARFRGRSGVIRLQTMKAKPSIEKILGPSPANKAQKVDSWRSRSIGGPGTAVEALDGTMTRAEVDHHLTKSEFARWLRLSPSRVGTYVTIQWESCGHQRPDTEARWRSAGQELHPAKDKQARSEPRLE